MCKYHSFYDYFCGGLETIKSKMDGWMDGTIDGTTMDEGTTFRDGFETTTIVFVVVGTEGDCVTTVVVGGIRIGVVVGVR